MRQIRFRKDRQPINETDIPEQLEVEDEDTIVFQQHRRYLQKGEPATLLQNSVPPDQEDILNCKTAIWFHHTLTTTV